jgi:tellurite resistance protein TerC
MDINLLLWGGFVFFILALLALDLGILQRKPRVLDTREAFILYGSWTSLALLFGAGIFFFHERGTQAALEFFTGFLVEQSLSIDNIFVFVLIFNYFRVPPLFQHKVLFWGILGAIILRAAFILGGLALLERFHWMMYVFGALLVFTGISMMWNKDKKTDPEKNWVIRLFRRWFPVSKEYDEGKFFTRRWGALTATPLFVALLAIESTDIVFAVDSIPAIFAITRDPFIVFTSNIFAMMGLHVPRTALRVRVDHPHPRREDAGQRLLRDPGRCLAHPHSRHPSRLHHRLTSAPPGGGAQDAFRTARETRTHALPPATAHRERG